MARGEVTREDLARAVLSLAYTAGMPDSFWSTDRRVLMACGVLGLTPSEALTWSREELQ